jgi:hypothetical protein
MAYSRDIRLRVTQAVASGMSRGAAAEPLRGGREYGDPLGGACVA